MAKSTREARERRHRRVRNNLTGTTERPRLNVYRSLEHIYAQVIDDTVGHTLASASTLDAEVKKKIALKQRPKHHSPEARPRKALQDIIHHVEEILRTESRQPVRLTTVPNPTNV